MRKTLTVFGKKVKVKTQAGLTQKGVCGLFLAEEGQIVLCSSLKGEERLQTLLHEFFHAVIARVSVNQAINNEIEEVIVDTLATALIENFTVDIK